MSDLNDNSRGQSMGLDGVIAKLMSDPSLMATVTQAVSAMKSSAVGTEEKTDGNTSNAENGEQKNNDVNAGSTPTPDQLKSFNLSPEMLASISSMLGGATLNSEKKTSSKQDENSKKRCALLAALKPYLNSHRCETIDYMLSIDRLSNALKTVKKQ